MWFMQEKENTSPPLLGWRAHPSPNPCCKQELHLDVYWALSIRQQSQEAWIPQTLPFLTTQHLDNSSLAQSHTSSKNMFNDPRF